MCAQNYLHTLQLITYTQVNVCTKLPINCAVNILHAVNVCTKLPTHRAVNTLQAVNVCTKLPIHCAVNILHAGKCVYKTTYTLCI